MTDHSTVVWVHGDCLSPYGPALSTYPGVPSIWVWDEELLAQWRISLKRIVFIYECLLELPVAIRRGDVAKEVANFAGEHNATTIATTDSPSPRFAKICQELRLAGFKVKVYPVEPFIEYDGDFDLKRFSRYWRVAQKYAF